MFKNKQRTRLLVLLVTSALLLTNIIPGLSQDAYGAAAPGDINLAPEYTENVTASSTYSGYNCMSVVDSVYEGYGTWQHPVKDSTTEWATAGGAANNTGAWIQLDFKQPLTITEVCLYNRVYDNEAIKTGTLTFSDGSSESVTFPSNVTGNTTPKSPAIAAFTAKEDIEWVKFTVGEYSSSNAVGLAEFMVFGPVPEEGPGPSPEPDGPFRIDDVSNPYRGGAWSSGNPFPSIFAFSGGSAWWSDTWAWMYDNCNNVGDYLDFSFTGTSIALYASRMNYGGIMKVYLDGSLEEIIDTYNEGVTALTTEKIFEREDLTAGAHVLRVEIAGKNANVSGSAYIVIKAFEYGTGDSGWTEPGIKITSLPDKTEYAMGESLDLTGLEVMYYDGENDPAPIEVTTAMLGGFDSGTVGTRAVTVTYNSYTKSFLVDIVLPPLPAGILNLAELYAFSITASSTTGGYNPWNVANGIYENYGDWTTVPRQDQTAEWASNGEKAGAWIEIDFEYPVSVTEIRLFDRVYRTDATFTGTLTFSDGSSEAVVFPPLNPYPKTPAIVTFAQAKEGIQWVRFTVDTCHPSANAVGLAEFQVFGPDVDFLFRPENSAMEVVPGENMTVTILRNEEAQALSGTYEFDLPEGWAVVSGGDFTAGSEADDIVISVPIDYFETSGEIAFTAKSPTGEPYGYTMRIRIKATGYHVIDRVITVFSPAYYSEVTDEEIEIAFHAPGFTKARASSLHAPDAANDNPYGYMKEVAGEFPLDTNEYGKGTFTFNAADFPNGPVSIHITAWNDSGEADDCFLQLYNYAGVEWDGGPANTIGTIPSAITEHGLDMEPVFVDEFTEMPVITYTGAGEDVKYAAAKPDPVKWPEYSDSKFAPPGYSYGDIVTDYSPFAIADEQYMKIETKYWGAVIEPRWGQTFTTGFLSSMGTDGSGFVTQPGAAQYYETRLFLPPNPGLWPAFWTLSPNSPDGRPGNDELDILEAYMGGNPERFTFNHHTWGDGYGGIHTGSSGNTADFGNGVSLAEGWHTYGMLVTEEYTYYYFDDIYIEGSVHPTLDRSWTVGNYFMVNNAYRQSDADKFPGGFQRYGNTAEMYVDWVRVYQVENEGFSPMYSSAKVTPGHTAAVEILRSDEAKDLSGAYEIALPEGWTVESGQTFTAGSSKDTIVLSIPEGFTQFQGVFSITPVVGSTRHETMEISFKTQGLYTTEIYPSLNATGDGYVINFKYINTSPGAYENIVVAAEGPEGWSQTQTISTVGPEESKVITFPAPLLDLYKTSLFTFDVTLAEGYTVTLERPISGFAASKTETPITVDGTVHEDEWEGAMSLVLNQQSQTYGTWTGPEDLSATGKVKWDDDYLYVAVEVTDNTHSMTQNNIVDAWAGDSLQISLDPVRSAGPVEAGAHLSFTAALNSTTSAYGVAVDRCDYGDLGLSWGQLLSRSSCVVARNEARKTTTYTIAFAWEDILPDAYTGSADLGIAFVINDSDGAGRKGWIRYMDGIATGKDPMKFGDLILAGEIAPAPAYAVNIAEVAGGEAAVTADPETAVEGETVTVYVTGIEAGKQFKSISVTGEVCGTVETEEIVPGEEYTFLMPGEAVTVAVEVEPAETAPAYTLAIGGENTGGAGRIRSITIGGSEADNLEGKYLVVQFTEGEGTGAKVSVVMISPTSREIAVSYQTTGTEVEAWLTDGMPDLTAEDMGMAVHAHAGSNR